MTMHICWRPRPADEISSPSDPRGVSLKKIAPQRPSRLWEKESLNSCHHSSHHKSRSALLGDCTEKKCPQVQHLGPQGSGSLAPYGKATPVVDVRKGRADCLKVVCEALVLAVHASRPRGARGGASLPAARML